MSQEEVKIELKSAEGRIAALDVIKKKAEFLTKRRIVQGQEEAALQELEKASQKDIESSKKS